MTEVLVDVDLESENSIDDEDESVVNPKKTTKGGKIGKRRRDYFTKIPFTNDAYFDVNYRKRNMAIIVGGETQGLSAEAHRFTFEREGQKIHIPMTGGVDSLNTAVAASVVIYEIKRQLAVY